MVPMTEHEITIVEDSVALRAEDQSLEESTTPEVEVDVPSASSKVLAPVVVAIEPSVLVFDSFMEPTQPSLCLAITQGSCQPRQFFSFLCI